MTFGKLIAWNNETQRGILEDRLGNTFKVERKDFLEERAMVMGTELTFSYNEITREAYSVETSSTGFARFQEHVGRFIA